MRKYKENDIFLAKWINNELTKEELLEFQNSDDYEALSKIAERSTEFEIPDFDQKGVRNEIEKTIYFSKKSFKPMYYRIAIAASFALIVVLGGLNYFANQNTILVTRIGESRIFVLPDDSEIEMNGKAKITYNKNDWKEGKRFLQLEGEAYFKVKKGSKFTVESDRASTSVLGTRFNIKALNNFYAVECYEGKVLIEKEAKKTVIVGGNGLHFKNGNQYKSTFGIRKPNWKSKIYIYDKEPLFVVFNDLQNIYKIVDLQVRNTDLSQDFTGKLVIDDLEKALAVICKPMNLKYSLSKNVLIITPQ